MQLVQHCVNRYFGDVAGLEPTQLDLSGKPALHVARELLGIDAGCLNDSNDSFLIVHQRGPPQRLAAVHSLFGIRVAQNDFHCSEPQMDAM